MGLFCSWNCVIFFFCGGCYVTHIEGKNLPTIRERTTAVLGVRLPPISGVLLITVSTLGTLSRRVTCYLQLQHSFDGQLLGNTGLFKLNSIHLANVESLCHFFISSTYPFELLRTCSVSPSEPVTEMCVFVNLFSQDIWTCFGGGRHVWALRKPNFPAKENEVHLFTGGQGLTEHVWKNSGSTVHL